jgi:Tol biopolymer transport system component
VLATDPAGARYVTAKGDQIIVHDARTHDARPYGVGRAGAASWSVGGNGLAFLTFTRTHRTLWYLDLDAGVATPLHTGPIGVGSVPAVSPDGTQVAYIDSHGLRHGAPRLRVNVVPTQGGTARVLHTIGQCYCQQSWPAVTWSPDGRIIAVTSPGFPARDQVGGAVWTVHPDGTDWGQLAVGLFQDRLAWQPVVSPEE